MRFGTWHAIDEAARAAPEAPGLLQVRSDGLHQYPSGRSAMMLYVACAPGETLGELVRGRARSLIDNAVAAGGRWIRFAVTDNAHADGTRLLARFAERFGAAPTINQDPLVKNG